MNSGKKPRVSAGYDVAPVVSSNFFTGRTSVGLEFLVSFDLGDQEEALRILRIAAADVARQIEEAGS